jgi:hypothetical protein
MKKKNERSSVTLRWLKNQLREEAIKEKDEERKKKLWRWYFRAEDAEREVDILVLKAEIRALLEIAAEHGIIDRELLKLHMVRDDDEDDSEAPPKPKQSRGKKKPADDENLPKQMSLWDET